MDSQPTDRRHMAGRAAVHSKRCQVHFRSTAEQDVRITDPSLRPGNNWRNTERDRHKPDTGSVPPSNSLRLFRAEHTGGIWDPSPTYSVSLLQRLLQDQEQPLQ